MKNKWLIYIILIVIVFIAVVVFASEIQMWFMSKLAYLLILLCVFIIGWLLGRFGGGRKQNKNA